MSSASSVSVFVLDAWEADQDWEANPANNRRRTREWEKILPSFGRMYFRELEAGKWVPTATSERSILVAHRTPLLEHFNGYEDRMINALKKLVHETPGLHIILVGGNAQDGVEISSNIYSRGAKVDYPLDERFSRLFAQFVSSFAQQPTAYHLLEPDPVPDHLVAVYLIALAAEAANTENATTSGFAQEELRGLMARGDPESDPWAVARDEFGKLILQTPYAGRRTEFTDQTWPDCVFVDGRPKQDFVNALRCVLDQASQPIAKMS